MAPRGSGPRRQTQSQPEQLYRLGQAGRKTGVTLETGARDEHGFEDHEKLFSSPTPERTFPQRPNTQPVHADDSDSDDGEDMELDDGSEAGPATIRKLQGQSRPSLPRSRSPIKTHLQSPARQNPHLGPTSSPVRGAVYEPAGRSPGKQVKRKLDFSASAQSQPQTHSQMRPASAKPNGGPRKGRTVDDSETEPNTRAPPKTSQRPRQTIEEEYSEDEEPMDIVDAGDEVDYNQHQPDEDEEEEEEEEEEEPQPLPPVKKASQGRKPKSLPPVEEDEEEPQPVKKASRGRKPKSPPPAEVSEPEGSQDEADENPVPAVQPKNPKPARGRPKANAAPPAKPSATSKPQKRKQDAEDDEPRKRRVADPSPAPAAPAAPPKGKPGRKPKSIVKNNVDSPGIQRGPPLPKARGLVSMRRDDADGILTTRSGRTSVRPLDFWKNERYEFDDNVDIHDDKKGHFVTKNIKGVIRYQDEAPQTTKRGPRGRSAASGKGRSKKHVPEEEPIKRDDWEMDIGHIEGPCKAWYPEYETDPPAEDEAELTDKEIAVSQAAIPYKEVKGANFRFAKVLSNSFFGAGLLELPSGAEKSRKNSRKMQLAFFVSEGAVEVTVADNEFRIAKGGMFFIPRGNQYSIANEEDTTALLFFCQGAEVRVESAPQSQVL